MLDVIVVVVVSYVFMGMMKMGMVVIFEMCGNDDVYVILCGGKNGLNYDVKYVEVSCVVLCKVGLCE